MNDSVLVWSVCSGKTMASYNSTKQRGPEHITAMTRTSEQLNSLTECGFFEYGSEAMAGGLRSHDEVSCVHPC